MKNIDIHKSLPESDVRDFLGQQKGCCHPDEYIKHLEEQVKKAKAELSNARKERAVAELIKTKGWCQFDVSNEIEDYSSATYFEFIGTKNELAATFPDTYKDMYLT